MRTIIWAACLMLATSTHAAQRSAAPSNFSAQFAAARPGDTLVLQGDFGIVVAQGRTFDPPLTIQAADAKFTKVILKQVVGINWNAGSFRGADLNGGMVVSQSRKVRLEGLKFSGDGRMNAVTFRDSQDVAILNSEFVRPRVGIGLINVERGLVKGNNVMGWSADAYALSGTTQTVVTKNRCVDPVPVDSGIHVDCIQGYFAAPKANKDVSITENYVRGHATQGIFFNATKGWPFPERIVIADNVVETSDAPNGVLLDGDPEGEVRNNRASTLPGSKYPTLVKVLDPRTARCGNKSDAYERWRGAEDKPCGKEPRN